MPDRVHTAARGTSSEAGPSREQWDAHKHIIIRLYRAHKLKEVQHIMQSNYEFYASKRMYDRRLQTWGITKNLKADNKEDLINMLVSTGTWVGERLPPKGQQLPISLKDQAKLVRHLKDRRRRRSTSPGTSSSKFCSPGRSPPAPQPCGSSPASMSDLLGPWTMIQSPAEPATSGTGSPEESPQVITSDCQNLHHYDAGEIPVISHLDTKPPIVDFLTAKHASSSLEGNVGSSSTESDSPTDLHLSPTPHLALCPTPVSPRGVPNVEKILLSI